MSKQEYSQAVRDVVRAIGKHGWVGFDNMLRDLDARNVWIAKRDGLVTMAMICASSTFVLTDKGRELLREMQGEEKAPKSDRYPMCTDQPAQIDCRRAACQYHGVGDGCTNSSPAITLKEDSYHVTCWSFKVREPHPEPASELKPCPFCGCETEVVPGGADGAWYGRCMSPMCGWELGPFFSSALVVAAVNRRA